MIPRATLSWQLVLADLALILFLVALAGLAGATATPRAIEPLSVAPAQALYREAAGGPTLAAWLGEQARDDRSTLTIFARHPPAQRDEAWARAQRLAASVENANVPVRVVLEEGATTEVYASLAYDVSRDPAPAEGQNTR